MDKAIKESFYEINAKFEEEFETVEKAHSSNAPSENAKVDVLDVKLDKSRIKLKKGEKDHGK
ncbi:hypothetical protein [uncultured Mediterranean phage uvMED]|nr:hypothetical protein [uncultured Mediterranean phage uvMED]BAR19026.1 hypothetical protein [uncultured Mediterranean phage uvMED]BAR19121.1 hypothetical protein [uncultured Mediterranean phage uvMED]